MTAQQLPVPDASSSRGSSAASTISADFTTAGCFQRFPRFPVALNTPANAGLQQTVLDLIQRAEYAFIREFIAITKGAAGIYILIVMSPTTHLHPALVAARYIASYKQGSLLET